jgi:hypothetical protein
MRMQEMKLGADGYVRVEAICTSYPRALIPSSREDSFDYANQPGDRTYFFLYPDAEVREAPTGDWVIYAERGSPYGCIVRFPDHIDFRPKPGGAVEGLIPIMNEKDCENARTDRDAST